MVAMCLKNVYIVKNKGNQDEHRTDEKNFGG